MDTLEALVAAEAIRQAACRYSRGVDRLDPALMKSAYHPDATDDHGVYVGNAHEFCDWVIARHQGKDGATMHCILNHAIELDDANRARGEVYNVTYRVRSEDDGAETLDTAWGRYVDRYERREGEWRIAHRTWVHEFSHCQPLRRSATAFEKFRQGADDRGRPPAVLGPAAFGQ
jgi:SnoaL-like domain